MQMTERENDPGKGGFLEQRKAASLHRSTSHALIHSAVVSLFSPKSLMSTVSHPTSLAARFGMLPVIRSYVAGTMLSKPAPCSLFGEHARLENSTIPLP